MKKLFIFLLTIVTYNLATAQNVGIGTTTPSSRLHLIGNLLQESGTVTLNNAAGIIQFQNTGVNKTFVQLTGDNLRLGTNSGNQFGKTIFRMSGQDRILIDSTGNMQVLGLQDASLTSHGYLTLGNITGDNLIIDNNEIMARNNGNADNLILQNDGGNVGIGVGSPAAKLHINGDVIVANTGASLQLRDEGNINKGFFQLSGNNVRFGTNSGNATGNLVIRMNGNDRVTIKPSGDMDIDGKLTRSAVTGNTSLVPICMGKIDFDGTIMAGTGNFTVNLIQVIGSVYRISCPQVTPSSIIIVTPAQQVVEYSYGGFYSDGVMKVQSLSAFRFQFVIYNLD
jgi:hypothetical protein